MGPIAVFDSGVGGLSVLRELVAQMPSEHFLYFGDSANAPYGTRPTAEIRSLTLAHAERLFDRGDPREALNSLMLRDRTSEAEDAAWAR